MSTAKIEERLVALKREIKEWEHSFAKENGGKAPQYADVKENTEITKKYKKYEKYKKLLKSKTTAREVKPAETTGELQDTAVEEEEEEEPMVITELGPTPQLKGRVLGLFDISIKQAQILETPTKNNEDVFKTPTKRGKVLSFGDDALTPSTARVLRTPAQDVMETPAYLRKESKQLDFIHFGSSPTLAPTSDLMTTPTKWQSSLSPSKFTEPSPMLQPRTKSIFQIGHEVEELKRRRLDMHESDIEDEDIRLLIQQENKALSQPPEEDEDEPKEPEAPAEPVKKKARTQKRSTRRVRIKTMPVNMNDDLADVDIHKRIQGGEDEEDVEFSEEEDEEDEQSDGEYERAKKAKWAKLDTQKRNDYVSNNYVRLKINQKKGKFFKRR